MYAGTKAQMEALAGILLGEWRKKYGDEKADWFGKEYLSDPWLCWNVGWSCRPGVLPTAQPIESDNASCKKAVWGRQNLRGCTEYVLGTALPKMVNTASLDKVGPITLNCDVIEEEQINKAAEVIKKGLWKEVERPDGERWVYMNSSFRCEATSKTAVTSKRIAAYEEGLAGKVHKGVRTIESYCKVHMSLHKVVATLAPQQTLEGRQEWDYRCDCKAFMHAQTCSHELVCQHVDKVIEIAVLLTDLDKNRKRGRSALTAPALVRQDVYESMDTRRKKQARRR